MLMLGRVHGIEYRTMITPENRSSETQWPQRVHELRTSAPREGLATPSKLWQLEVTHAAGHTDLTLRRLRRNQRRAVDAAIRYADEALGSGDIVRAVSFIELACALADDSAGC